MRFSGFGGTLILTVACALFCVPPLFADEFDSSDEIVLPPATGYDLPPTGEIILPTDLPLTDEVQVFSICSSRMFKAGQKTLRPGIEEVSSYQMKPIKEGKITRVFKTFYRDSEGNIRPAAFKEIIDRKSAEEFSAVDNEYQHLVTIQEGAGEDAIFFPRPLQLVAGESVAVEWIEGETLLRAAKRKTITSARSRKILQQLKQIVAALDRLKIAHADLDPENIVLTADGVRLLDFGIAVRFDTLHVSRGTQGFNSPSQKQVGTSHHSQAVATQRCNQSGLLSICQFIQDAVAFNEGRPFHNELLKADSR